MKTCPNCQNQINDAAMFCPNCGAQFAAPQGNPDQQAPNYNQPPYGYAPQPAYDPFDHTAEFDAKDISDNKVIGMLIYLAGYIGILVALLMANTSKFVSFHIRQALKFEVTALLFGLAYGVGLFVIALIALIPVLGWIIAGIYVLIGLAVPAVLFVLKIICFVDICKGQAKEPALIRNLKFMK